MPTGSGPLRYVAVDGRSPQPFLDVDHCYVQVKLHEVQAVFKSNWLTRPGVLTLSSSVTSTFQSGAKLESLYRIETLERNKPCRLGLGINLTDWLPARSPDAIGLEFTCTAIQGKPIEDLMTHLKKAGVDTLISQLGPNWKAAVKVSETAGKLISYLSGAGTAKSLPLKFDLNLNALQLGYYAVVGSATDEPWPSALKMDAIGRLLTQTGSEVLNCSYVVIQVKQLDRRGVEAVQNEAWCALLLEAKQEILQTCQLRAIEAEEQQQWLASWEQTLKHVRRLLAQQQLTQQQNCLPQEIDEIMQTACMEVLTALQPSTQPESFGTEELPTTWRELLHVRTLGELTQSVERYQRLLERSQSSLEGAELMS
jgi:hypothetical protein